MIKEKFKSVKAQTALEYIAACFVFATVGIGTFLAVNQASVSSTAGTRSNYGSDQTLQGAALEGAGSLPETEWPADWGTPQEGLGGARPIDTAEAAENATSTWNNNQENNLTGQEGQYWNENNGSQTGVNLPPPGQNNSPTPGQLQAEFNRLTQGYLSQNQAGYSSQDLNYVNQGLSDNWFIGSNGQ